MAVVEDQESDIVLLRKAFEKGRLPNPIYFVRNGEDAIAYLSGQGSYSNRAENPLPELVLLDLNLPGMGGFEVLKWIRQREGIRGLPVVILTTSEHIADINRAYEFGANSFLAKEFDFDNLIELNKLLEQYRLRATRATQTLPPLQGEARGRARHRIGAKAAEFRA